MYFLISDILDLFFYWEYRVFDEMPFCFRIWDFFRSWNLITSENGEVFFLHSVEK